MYVKLYIGEGYSDKYVRTKKEMMMIIRLCVFESDLEVPRVPATQATLSPFQDGARLGNIQDPSSKMEQDGERSKMERDWKNSGISSNFVNTYVLC